MKESVTKFDLESAFKALDEIDVPVSEKGIKANKPALTEIFSRKSKFDALFEEYYDIGSTEELGEAKEAREAEIAKAKLARIEKIVDLDADSPEDLLTSYVGKYIIQCPQCMTLFYKDKEDVIESEDDPTNVNVGEACQHCGNDSGYTLIGKVGEAEPEESAELEAEVPMEEIPVEEDPTEEPSEEPSEETSEESVDGDEDLGDFDLDALNLDDEPAEEEKKEESFVAHEGEALVEEIKDDDLDAKLKAHGYYIEYLRAMISQDEKALEKADNEQVKAAIQRRIDAFKADLEAALPSEVKDELVADDLPTPEEVSEEPAGEANGEGSTSENVDENEVAEKQEESFVVDGQRLTEALQEEAELDVSAEEFEKLIKEPEFTRPISDTAVRAMMNTEKASEEVEESIESAALEEGIFDNIKNAIGKAKEGISKFIDEKIKSRADGAEFILKNALKDYNNATINNDGSIETADDNRKFNTFVIAYFTNKFNDGSDISSAPTPSDIDKLVKGKDSEAKIKYTDAENLAKGWSKIADNGPAIIFMANGLTDASAEFLCMYFNGDLDKASDQLAKRIEIVKNGLRGAKTMAKGKPGQADTKQVKASELKKGMQINTKKKGVGEITEIAEGDTLDFKVTYKLSDGSITAVEYAAGQLIDVLALPVAMESLNVSMTDIEGLQESVLESLIAESLIETYGNVAGFRLANYEHLDEKLNVNGTIYFTSGNTRKTTYSFSEALVEEGKITLKGLNEKLGLDKQFTLIGHVDEAKTLITESFSYNKK